MKVALTYNLKPESSLTETKTDKGDTFLDEFAEWDSIETINAVKNALQENHEVVMIEADLNAFEKFKKVKPEIVFNISEGKDFISREAQIPAMLDMLKIPYTGSDPLTLCLCLDKARTKEVLSHYKINTPSFWVSDLHDNFFSEIKKFPLMTKPIGEGSSKGIFNDSIVQNENDLKNNILKNKERYNQPSLIEEFLPGREFTVAILGNGDETVALPIVEINYDGFPKELNKIYSYEAKWIFDNVDNPLEVFQCPADVSPSLEKKIKDIALRAYKALRCKDWSRIDIRLDENEEPNIIEINPLPGILPDPKENSCYPKAAFTYGFTYNEMINAVLNSAIKRYGLA